MTKIVLLMLTLTNFPLFANTETTILWQTYHRPPGIFKSGPDAGNGFVEKVLNLIIARLPDYQHEKPFTTLARALSNIKAAKNVCHPALYKTEERHKYMVFSNLSMINPTNRIIVKKGKLDNLVRKGEVNLVSMLAEPELTFALVKGRSFTQEIDNLLNTHLIQENLLNMSNTDLGLLFRMIVKGRIDASIAYPFEINYYLKQHPRARQNIEIYAMQGMPRYTFGAVACPNNAWGKEVIKQVNAALEVLKPTAQYQQALTTWWEHERTQPEFQRVYRDTFLKN